MRTELWASDATRSELIEVENLSIRIEVREKELKKLRKRRWWIVNKARNRSAYRRGLVAKSRRKAKP